VAGTGQPAEDELSTITVTMNFDSHYQCLLHV